MLVYDEMAPIISWRIAIVRGVLASRDSEIRRAAARIAKTNTILKCAVNKLLTVENTYRDNNQTDKTREQNVRREAAVVDKQKRKFES